MEIGSYIEILKKIGMSCIDDPDSMELLAVLQKDYEEIHNKNESDGQDFKTQYEDLKSKYIERFFSSTEEAKKDQKEDVKKDGEKETFEELFEERKS